MASNEETFHGEILTTLATASISHTAKAAILFSEAITELKTGIDMGELSDATTAWHEILNVVTDEAKDYLS